MYKFWKRFFDICIALFALIALAWLLLPCMLILLCTGEHYVFYYQERIGKGGKPFKIIKFTTMLFNSPNMPGGTITTRNDPRVLPFGRFLRMTKINELPQILNVLNGTMSIVGSRPLVVAGYNLYSPEVQKCIYSINPGVTGLGSLFLRDEEKYLSAQSDPEKFYREEIIPFKASLEKWYHDHMSLGTDLIIIILTAMVILFPRTRNYSFFLKDLPPSPKWLDGLR